MVNIFGLELGMCTSSIYASRNKKRVVEQKNVHLPFLYFLPIGSRFVETRNNSSKN